MSPEKRHRWYLVYRYAKTHGISTAPTGAGHRHRSSLWQYEAAAHEERQQRLAARLAQHQSERTGPPVVAHCGAWHPIAGLPFACPACGVTLFAQREEHNHAA